MQKSLKWAPAQPIRRSDNIISSKARETGDVGFTPSYLAEPKEDMRFIMSNEYMRIWYKERGTHEKNTYSKEEIIKEESKIKRRFVQRMMTYKKPDKNEFLEDRIQKKLGESKDQPVDYRKFKYKPVCSKPKEQVLGEADATDRSDPKTSKQNIKKKVKRNAKKGKQVKSDHAEDSPPIILCPTDPTCCVPCCPAP